MSGKAEPPGDPSMDDILASIRRILDEEETRPPKAAEPEQDDVLELEPSMLVPEPDEATSGPVPGPPPILLESTPVTETPVVPPSPTEPAGLAVPLPPPVAVPPLMAPEAAAAAAVSVNALMRTLASERTAAVYRGGPTIEDLVREEMRPLLKEWLDNHLAPVVERLVRAEIERVVSRST